MITTNMFYLQIISSALELSVNTIAVIQLCVYSNISVLGGDVRISASQEALTPDLPHLRT